MGAWQSTFINTKIEIPVPERSLKSSTLSITSPQLRITFDGWQTTVMNIKSEMPVLVQTLKSSTMGFTNYLLGIAF